MKTPKLATEGKHRCDNCSATHLAGRLKDIDRLGERVEPGGVVPSGECPNCGSLCYPVKENKTVKLIDRQLADVSTGHMKRKDSELLDEVACERGNPGSSLILVHKYDEGYFLYCGDARMLPKRDQGFSKALVKLCKMALSQGFAYINFDRDGECYDGLKEFDW